MGWFCGVLFPGRIGISFGNGCGRVGFHRDLDFCTLLELDFLSILIDQGIFDANLFVQIIGAIDSDLCFLRLGGNHRLDDLFDGSSQVYTRFFRHNSGNYTAEAVEFEVRIRGFP